MIKNKAMENTYGQIKQLILESGIKIKCTDKEHLKIRTVKFYKAFGLIINIMAHIFNNQISKMIKKMLFDF